MAAVVLAARARAGRRRRAPARPARARASPSARVVFVPLCAWRVPEVAHEVRALVRRVAARRDGPDPADPEARPAITTVQAMHHADPDVSVVAATHNRAERLAAMLAGLRARPSGRTASSVVIVDDASSDETPACSRREARRGRLRLRTRRQEPGGGPGRGAQPRLADGDAHRDRLHRRRLRARRRAGWRRMLDWPRATRRRRRPGTDAAEPAPRPTRSTATRRRCSITGPTPHFETCNIVYPRALLEQLAGFDETYPAPAGEDSDLGVRALEARRASRCSRRRRSCTTPSSTRTPRAALNDALHGHARRPGLQAQPRRCAST